MAHPLAVPLGFSVMGARTLWWGGCAWDSFALPHLLPGEDEVLVATRCPACQRPHAWNVGSRRPPDGEQVAHFLVPAARMWDDVVHTCGHQRLFCSERLRRGLARGHRATRRGYVMDLATLWRLAAHWYDGRLDRGYIRREPSAGRGVPAGRRAGRIVLGALTGGRYLGGSEATWLRARAIQRSSSGRRRPPSGDRRS